MKMKYYKLSMNMERENDIVCHYKNDYGIRQNALNTGRFFEDWDDRFEFFYVKEEGDVWTGTIYTVSKYGIYADKTDGADVFKLSDRQQIPIFVSEKFKNLIERENITGISLTEIEVV